MNVYEHAATISEEEVLSLPADYLLGYQDYPGVRFSSDHHRKYGGSPPLVVYAEQFGINVMRHHPDFRYLLEKEETERSQNPFLHTAAQFGAIPDEWLNRNLCRKRDRHGRTVYHVLAKAGLLPQKFMEEPYLKITSLQDGITVAHTLAKYWGLPEHLCTDRILGLKDAQGRTVLHQLVSRHKDAIRLITREQLSEATQSGTTLAHAAAACSSLPDEWIDDEVLRMKDKFSGETVAHILARQDRLPERFWTEDVLLLGHEAWGRAGREVAVACILCEKGRLQFEHLTPKVAEIRMPNGLLIGEILAMTPRNETGANEAPARKKRKAL